MTSIWRNRDFVVLWSGRLVSTLGSGISAIGLPLLVLAISGSPTKAGLIAALNGAPYFLLAVPAGVAADRLSRWAILIACDAGRGVAWAVVGITVALGRPSFYVIGAAAVVEGSLFVFHNTAISAGLPRVVSSDQLPAAMAQESVILGTSDLLGPAIGGALFQAGRAIPFLTDALSYLASIAAVVALRRPLGGAEDRDHQSLLVQAREGLRFLWAEPALRTMSLAGGLGDMVFAGITLVVIVTAQRRAHASAAEVGAIFAAGAAAGILGAVVGGRLLDRLGIGTTYLGFGVLGAVVFPGLLLARSVVSIGALWAANVAILGVANVARGTFQVQLVPDQLRGRVNGLVDLVSYGGLPVGTALAGVCLGAVGPVPTLGAMAVARILLTGWLVATPAIRDPSVGPAPA